jgi:hypothetical protein
MRGEKKHAAKDHNFKKPAIENNNIYCEYKVYRKVG